jgi:hypothetical protein
LTFDILNADPLEQAEQPAMATAMGQGYDYSVGSDGVCVVDLCVSLIQGPEEDASAKEPRRTVSDD